MHQLHAIGLPLLTLIVLVLFNFNPSSSEFSGFTVFGRKSMTGVLCSFICLPLTSVVSLKPFCHISLPPSSEQELARSAKKYFSTRKLSSLALPACILSSPSTWLPSSQWPGGRGIVQKSLGLPTNLLLSSKSPWNSGSLERVVRSSLLFLLTEYTEDLNHKWVWRSLLMQPSFWEGTFLQFCLWCLDLGKDFGSQKVDIQQWEPGTARK